MTWVLNRSVNDNVLIAGGFLEAKKKFNPDWLKYNKISIELGEGARRFSEDEMPREFRIEKKRELPDMFMASSGKWVASDAARQVIERLDPGLHQFFAINVQFPDGTSPEGEWFDEHYCSQEGNDRYRVCDQAHCFE